ncbi:PorP/SprF family type IX secretion system membrane protein [Neolewinella lacunae]|uniref:PorP/SprF family type IX secretion system membrane protein n=1 Tax=Neolewinella lacunae TaxID=1517758 RepID=A0A923T8V0_9BACT|nr:PorP/SprF family type IX secretion system membrane protein [Neolewinella lacunae]MBC6994916.1 PorP/SprF family type IX secretion system membrane protein [Neolewinella lacunae]MDN3633505.1 PorP/SprF family type IX secretion system membrane protein [Neolewinella lacunae]
MKKLIPLLLLAMLSGAAVAQDYHFSQFFSTPLALNPALTGLFPGRYRVSIANRSQWGQTLETPFSTTAFSADFHYYINPRKRQYKDAFGVGVIFASDRVSEINYSVNQIMFGGAYHKSLDPKNNQTLSLGFQLGVVQRNVSYDRFTFDDAFDGTSTYVEGATGEELPINNYAFGDLHLGLSYSYAPKNRLGFFAGAAMHHVREPEQSFYAESTAGEDIEVTSTLDRRYSGFVNLTIPLTRNVQLSPRVYAFAQGPHLVTNAGGNFRFLMNDVKGAAVHLGAYARGVGNASGYGMDSAVATFGLEISDFLLGFSYDIGMNGLQTNRRHQGAFEINVAYLGQSDEDEAVPCPHF